MKISSVTGIMGIYSICQRHIMWHYQFYHTWLRPNKWKTICCDGVRVLTQNRLKNISAYIIIIIWLQVSRKVWTWIIIVTLRLFDNDGVFIVDPHKGNLQNTEVNINSLEYFNNLRVKNNTLHNIKHIIIWS